MNRRSFLKLLGISTVATVLPIEYKNTYLENLLENEVTVSFNKGHVEAIKITAQITQSMLSTKHLVRNDNKKDINITNTKGQINVVVDNRVYTPQEITSNNNILKQIKDVVTKRYIS